MYYLPVIPLAQVPFTLAISFSLCHILFPSCACSREMLQTPFCVIVFIRYLRHRHGKACLLAPSPLWKWLIFYLSIISTIPSSSKIVFTFSNCSSLSSVDSTTSTIFSINSSRLFLVIVFVLCTSLIYSFLIFNYILHYFVLFVK